MLHYLTILNAPPIYIHGFTGGRRQADYNISKITEGKLIRGGINLDHKIDLKYPRRM